MTIGDTPKAGTLRVLLVEDDDLTAGIASSLLEDATRAQYVVERAPTVAAATAQLAAAQYDALVLDVRLPDGDGITLLRQLRAGGVATPALVYTAAGDEHLIARALRAGAQDYLSKDAAFTEGALDHALASLVTRHSAETALRESEARFRALVEHSADAVVVVDAAGAVLYASPTVSGNIGYAPDELLGKSILSQVHPDDWEEAASRFSQVAASPGTSLSALFRRRHKDGSWRWIEATGTNRLQDPAIGGVVVNVRDITERKRAEEDLLVLTRRLRLLLEIATEIGPSLKLGAPLGTTLHTLVEALPEADTAAILLHDPQTDLLVPCAFVGLGDAYGQIRLRPGEGISGMSFLKGARLQHECPSHAEALYRSLSAENAALLQEAVRGRRLHHSVSVPLRTQEDQVLGVLTLGSSRADFLGDDLRMIEGVAAQLAVALENARLYGHVRHQADELATALAELKASQQQVVQQERLRALGQLASGIAHDLNNTLSPVVGFSELLLTTGEGLSHRQREWLSLIRTGAGDAAEVVRRLREFYRPRDIHDAFVPVDLAAVVEDTVALTRPKWKDDAQASGQTITLGVHLGQFPPIIGNPAELREALTNLIINAVDALPRGGSITVRTCVESGSAVLEVTDTGEGMSEDVRKKCVEPFFSTKGERGTGLGLAMVHGTVQRHGGNLEIDSAPERGTTIRLRLPAAAPAEVFPPELEQTVTPRGLRLLLVDDEPIVRAVTAALLEAEGHTVVRAASGAEALAALQTSAFDVLVTDRAMPGGMSGEQLAAASKELYAHLPVLLLTGYGDMMIAAGETPEGIDAILPKPVTRAALRASLAALLSPIKPRTYGN